MNRLREFYASLTLKPQGATMVVAAFLPIFAIIAMFPVVASLIGHFHDVPNAAILVPAMVTAPGYAIALLAPFAGLAVDRFGRRRLLLACTLAYGVVGSAPFFLQNLTPIIASRVLLGVCEAGILTIVNTLIADYWDDAGRRNWLMIQGVIGPVLQGAVLIGVSAVAAIRWNAGFLVYLVALPIFVAMYFTTFEPKKPGAADPAAVPADASITASDGPFPLAAALGVAALTFVTGLIYYVFIVNGSLAWAEIGVRDPMAVSRATFWPSMFVMAGAALFRVVSRYSSAAQIAVFMLLFAVGLGGIGLARDVPQLQLALILQQTAAGMSVPTLIAWAQSKFGFAHRGRGMGLWTSAFFLGQAVSPIVVGMIAGRTGTMQGAFFVAGAAALALAAGALVASLRRPHPVPVSHAQ